MNPENPRPPVLSGNTRTVARNSFWYGLEVSFGLVTAFFISIAVANTFGPDRLSYYNYVAWLTNVSITLGTFGMPATARKYMAEFLNCGEREVARATYLVTLKIQVYLALGIGAAALAVVLWLGDPQYRAAAVLLVAAVPPRLIATIPSQANNAAEMLRLNTGPSLAGAAATAILTVVSLWSGWGLAGLAAALVIGSALECLLKLLAVERWLGGVARGTVSPELKRRMFAYSGQGLALMVLNIVVWDRSDVIILKALNHDPRQITFFSYAFTLSERVLLIPAMFGGSLSATMMAQFGRGRARLKEMTVDGGRYALLMSLPLLLGMACISRPLIMLLYINSYRLMIPTLTIVAIMAIPKGLITAPTMLLQASERQGFLILWGCVCGVIDIGLDILLTPAHGASGAAFANGSAQAVGALGIWIYAWKTNDLDLRLRDFGRIAASGAIMAAGVLATLWAIPGAWGMLVAIVLGAALWMIALRFTAALRPEDVGRLLSLGEQLPMGPRRHWKRLMSWLAPGNPMA